MTQTVTVAMTTTQLCAFRPQSFSSILFWVTLSWPPLWPPLFHRSNSVSLCLSPLCVRDGGVYFELGEVGGGGGVGGGVASERH